MRPSKQGRRAIAWRRDQTRTYGHLISANCQIIWASGANRTPELLESGALLRPASVRLLSSPMVGAGRRETHEKRWHGPHAATSRFDICSDSYLSSHPISAYLWPVTSRALSSTPNQFLEKSPRVDSTASSTPMGGPTGRETHNRCGPECEHGATSTWILLLTSSLSLSLASNVPSGFTDAEPVL